MHPQPRTARRHPHPRSNTSHLPAQGRHYTCTLHVDVVQSHFTLCICMSRGRRDPSGMQADGSCTNHHTSGVSPPTPMGRQPVDGPRHPPSVRPSRQTRVSASPAAAAPDGPAPHMCACNMSPMQPCRPVAASDWDAAVPKKKKAQASPASPQNMGPCPCHALRVAVLRTVCIRHAASYSLGRSVHTKAGWGHGICARDIDFIRAGEWPLGPSRARPSPL